MKPREVLYEFPRITQRVEIKPELEARYPKDSVFFLVQNVAFLSKDKNTTPKVGTLPRHPSSESYHRKSTSLGSFCGVGVAFGHT